MSLALYRKYRPATFAELKGQEHVAEPLQQALRNGRINHAYLFSGPARMRQDVQRADPRPLAELRAGADPRSVRRVRLLRRARARPAPGTSTSSRSTRPRTAASTTPATCGSGRSSRPVSARFKVYIIDEAHMVTREGFNALLKLVEEPPPHLKFVFATTEPEKVIGTIRSRTHHYPFRLIPPGDAARSCWRRSCGRRTSRTRPRRCRWSSARAPARRATRCRSSTSSSPASDEDGITYARAVVAARLHRRGAARRGRRRVRRARRRRGVRRRSTGWSRAARTRAGSPPTCWNAFRDLVILSNVPEAGRTGLLDVPAGRAGADAAAGRVARPGRADARRGPAAHGPHGDARRHVPAAAAGADLRPDPAARRVRGRGGPVRPPRPPGAPAAQGGFAAAQGSFPPARRPLSRCGASTRRRRAQAPAEQPPPSRGATPLPVSSPTRPGARGTAACG